MKNGDQKLVTVGTLGVRLKAMRKENRAEIKAMMNAMRKALEESTEAMREENNRKFGKCATRTELENQICEIKENMFTQSDYMKFLEIFDPVLREFQDSRRSRLLFEGQFVDLDDKVAGHEKRIAVLERKVD